MKRFRTVLAFVPRYRKYIFLGFGSLLLTQALALMVPRILGDAVNALESADFELSSIRTYALVLVLVVGLKGFFQFGMRWFLITTSRRVERDLRNRLYDHQLTLSPSFFDHRATGDLMSRAASDVEQVRLAIGPGVMYISNTIVTVPIALFFLLRMSPALTAFSLIPLVGIAILTKLLAPRMQDHSRRVQEASAQLSTRAQESFAGARVVKVFAREDNEIEEFEEEARGYLTASMGLARIRALLRPSLQALEGVGTLILLFAGGRLIIGDELTTGDLLAFFAYQRLLIWPMIAIGWVIALFQRGAAAMKRIDEILEVEPDVPDPLEAIDPGPVRGEIEVRGLTFAYDGEPVLRDIDLRVPAGTSLAIVGATGSGKSTLVELLLRMYPIPEGKILVDGVDLNRYALAHIRGAIGYVPQETFLFSDTIRGNVAYGLRDATDDQVLQAATRSQLAEEVREFPKDFDTRLGERGVNLSGGQKQRIAIARALILDPPILILDDALSAVDTQTEERILRELKEVMKARTTIVIGHRISTVKGADRIVVLDEGRVVESGTHEELLELGGKYAEMEKLQRLEEELEAF